jgi:hypothetical protein
LYRSNRAWPRLRSRINRILPRTESSNRAAEAEPGAGHLERRRDGCQIGARHQQLGAAVEQDIVDLLRRELGRDGNEPEPRPLRAPEQRKIIGSIGEEKGDARLGLKAPHPKKLGHPIRRGIEIGISHNRTGFGDDDGRFVGRYGCMTERMHDYPLDLPT